jgi:signal transduction histidine kinase
MSPEVREHIFDPYYSGREAGRGLGFGLCKAWRIVDEHGGNITVRTEPGLGSCFSIWISSV